MIWFVAVVASVGAGWLFGHGDAVSNGRHAAETAPQLLLTTMFGITVGLYGRDRVRLRRAYSSPSLSYAGKALFFVSFSTAAAWALSPLDWPPSCLHAGAVGGALGSLLWCGNLPPKL